jgi:hypothetical protein
VTPGTRAISSNTPAQSRVIRASSTPPHKAPLNRRRRRAVHPRPYSCPCLAALSRCRKHRPASPGTPRCLAAPRSVTADDRRALGRLWAPNRAPVNVPPRRPSWPDARESMLHRNAENGEERAAVGGRRANYLRSYLSREQSTHRQSVGCPAFAAGGVAAGTTAIGHFSGWFSE